MNDRFVFLAYLRDPFGVNNLRLWLMDSEGITREILPNELANVADSIVTYETWALVDELKKLNLSIPQRLINIGDGVRLKSGLSRDQSGEKVWDIWNALRPYFRKSQEWLTLKHTFLGRAERLDENAQQALLTHSTEAIKRLWNDLIIELNNTGEYERFFTVEVPLHQIFLYRQYESIAIDESQIKTLRRQAEDEKYKAYQEVASQIGIGPSGMRFSTVGPYLRKTDAYYLEEVSNQDNFEEHMGIASFSSKFANAFVTFNRANRDVLSLARMSGLSRVYPIFSTIGTVTGRILINDPHIQQLRRKYRSLFKADEGYELFYLDYSQFEPGILAAKSNDAELISAYNSTDLYNALAQKLFNDDSKRALCKRIFLAYCFGMSNQNITRLLAEPNATKEELANINVQVSQFFEKYKNAANYRKAMENMLEVQGEITTELGNRRIRTSKGALTAKEKRWAVSQSIQGSASLVFKEALLEIAKKFTPKSILIPMHDGVVLQLPQNSDAVDIALSTMKEAVVKRYTAISPKISCGPFA